MLNTRPNSSESGHSLRYLLVTLAVTGIAFLLASDLLKYHEFSVLVADILRDLGIALMIAVFVTIVIERYSADRLREDIVRDVVSAAYSKVVPEIIYKEIESNIFRSDVCREEWIVRIVAQKRSPELRVKNLAIIRSCTSYEVRNLNNHQTQYAVSGGIDRDIEDTNDLQGLPRFGYICVSEGAQTLFTTKILEEHSNEVLAKDDTSITRFDNNCTLVLSSTRQQIRFSVPIVIPAGKTVKVEFSSERGIRVPGSMVLYASAPAKGIEINAESQENDIKFRVIPLHPNRGGLSPNPPEDGTSPNGKWNFTSGILPWQGFQLRFD